MDIAAATGKPLATVTTALEKAYGGNLTALAKLAPEYRQMIQDGASFEDVMGAISVTTGGAATEAANTAAGQFQRLKVSLAETKETIGAALLPIIEKVLPYLQGLGSWASENTTAFLVIAGAIAGIAAAVILVNLAMTAWTAITTAFTVVQAILNAVMAANPIVLIVLAIVALIAGLVLAYKKFEGFKNIVDSVFKFIGQAIGGSVELVKSYFSTVLGFYKKIFNGIASLWNSTIGKLSFKVPSWVPGIGGKGFEVPNIPMLAQGGIVTGGATLAMIGEAGPEAVIPLDRMGEFGMGGGGMNITVNAGLVSSPDQVGQQIIEAIQKAQRRSGPVFAPA
jgi:hypothetical protein